MRFAFIKKELRELSGIVALAQVAELLAILSESGFMPTTYNMIEEIQPTVFPFVTCQFTTHFLLIQFCLAIAIGFRQSVWEHTQGTYLLLLHRPMTWPRIVRHKLVSGMIALVLSGTAPILLYVLIVAGPRPVPAPFEWSMTWPCWRGILISLPLYAASFVSGLRAGRWFGTRLLPVVGTALLLWPLMIIAEWVMFPAWLMICVVLQQALQHALTHRDFA